MNYIIIILILITLHLSYTDNKKSIIDIERIKYLTKKISIHRPVSNIKQFICNYIRKEIPLLTIKEQAFTKYINNKKSNLSNIIAYNSNTHSNKKIIILCAHIDSAISISLIIEIVRKLLLIDKYYPICIVLFDSKEAIGDKFTNDNALLGSTYFVDNLKNKNYLVFIINLTGGSIRKNPIKLFASNKKSCKIFNSFYIINRLLYNNDRVFVNSISYRQIKDDHIPFMKKNIDYIHLIPDNFPDQHHKLIDNIDWKYVNIFTYVIFNYLLNI